MEHVLLRRFPSLLGEDLEMLGAVRVAAHAHHHLGALMHAVILENIAAHPGIALGQGLPLRILLDHPLHDLGRSSRTPVSRSGYFMIRTPEQICRGIPARLN